MAKSKTKSKSTTDNSSAAEPSHDEVWDDSALLESWDAALQEYKKYHSLHARGLTVTEALHKYDAALANGAEHASAVDAAYEPPNEDMTGIDEHNQHNDPVNTEHSTMLHANGPSANQSQPAYPAAGPESGSSGTGLSGIPSALLSGPMGPASQDAGMKSLLMSWYYAGYYTGLHEGQQKAQGLSGPG